MKPLCAVLVTMPWFLFLVELAGLALGASYLWLKHRQRVRKWAPMEDPAIWIGHGLEASGLKPRIERVRRDYVGALPAARGVCFRRHLLGFTRRAVMQSGYFRHKDAEEQGCIEHPL
jgi:hypothetical protein